MGLQKDEVIKKVRAHPEHRKARMTWTPEDWGIYWADKVAGGSDEEFLQRGGEISEVSEAEVIDWVQDNATFTIRDTQGLLISSTTSKAASTDLQRYLANRDASRSSRGDPPRWLGISAVWAGRLHGFENLAKRAAVMRICWDWLEIGRNLGKQGKDPSCPLCGAEMEDLQHVTCLCTHTDLVSIRRKVFRDVGILVGKCKSGSVKSSVLQYVQHAKGPSGHEAWTGLFSLSSLMALDGVLEGDSKTMAGMVKLLRPMSDGLLELFQARQRVMDEVKINEYMSTDIRMVDGRNRAQVRAALARSKFRGWKDRNAPTPVSSVWRDEERLERMIDGLKTTSSFYSRFPKKREEIKRLKKRPHHTARNPGPLLRHHHYTEWTPPVSVVTPITNYYSVLFDSDDGSTNEDFNEVYDEEMGISVSRQEEAVVVAPPARGRKKVRRALQPQQSEDPLQPPPSALEMCRRDRFRDEELWEMRMRSGWTSEPHEPSDTRTTENRGGYGNVNAPSGNRVGIRNTYWIDPCISPLSFLLNN
jgi:hypothetical protein